jgi:hypothetical protein
MNNYDIRECKNCGREIEKDHPFSVKKGWVHLFPTIRAKPIGRFKDDPYASCGNAEPK